MLKEQNPVFSQMLYVFFDKLFSNLKLDSSINGVAVDCLLKGTTLLLSNAKEGGREGSNFCLVLQGQSQAPQDQHSGGLPAVFAAARCLVRRSQGTQSLAELQREGKTISSRRLLGSPDSCLCLKCHHHDNRPERPSTQRRLFATATSWFMSAERCKTSAAL